MTAAREVRPSSHIQLYARTVDAPVQWRLLSGNNRDIGRGTELFADAESCRLGVKELQTGLTHLESGIRRAPSNEWVWKVARDGETVAVSGRGFDRLIRCEQGLAQFLDQMRIAEVGCNVMVSQARRWFAVSGAVVR